MNTKFAAPPHLSERSTGIWEQLVPSRCRSVGRTVLLQTALEALDLSDRAAAELTETTSLLVKTLGSGTLHQHPAYKTAKEARAQFAALWSQLGLQFSGAEDGISLDGWLRQMKAREAGDE